MIRFACLSCQTILEVSDRDAGLQVACPHCQLYLHVPRPRAASDAVAVVSPLTPRPLRVFRDESPKPSPQLAAPLGAELAWLILSCIPFCGFVGWGIVAGRTRISRYWLFAIVYALPLIFFSVVTETMENAARQQRPQGEVSDSTDRSTRERQNERASRDKVEPPDFAVIPGVILWIGGMAHAFWVRREVQLGLTDARRRAETETRLPTAWRIWAFIPHFAWAAWLHAGIRSRHPAYFLLAGVYSLPLLLAMSVSPSGGEAPGWVTAVGITCWVIGILHTMIASKLVGARILQRQEGTSGEEDLDLRIRAGSLTAPLAEMPRVRRTSPSEEPAWVVPEDSQELAPTAVLAPPRAKRHKERMGLLKWLPTKEELLRDYVKELVMSGLGAGGLFLFQLLKRIIE